MAIVPGSAAVGTLQRVDRFSPANGQTEFLLSRRPASSESVLFLVNGVSFEAGSGRFSVSEKLVTWLDVGFALEASDSVAVVYPF
jgi:hypothetical protein